MTRFHPVCSLDELDDLVPKAVVVDGEPVALIRIDDDVFAVSDVCSHAEVALSDGQVDPDGSLSCWLHGSRFDLRTGEPLDPPAWDPVPVHRTVISHERGVATVSVALAPEQTQEKAV